MVNMLAPKTTYWIARPLARAYRCLAAGGGGPVLACERGGGGTGSGGGRGARGAGRARAGPDLLTSTPGHEPCERADRDAGEHHDHEVRLILHGAWGATSGNLRRAPEGRRAAWQVVGGRFGDAARQLGRQAPDARGRGRRDRRRGGPTGGRPLRGSRWRRPSRYGRFAETAAPMSLCAIWYGFARLCVLLLEKREFARKLDSRRTCETSWGSGTSYGAHNPPHLPPGGPRFHVPVSSSASPFFSTDPLPASSSSPQPVRQRHLRGEHYSQPFRGACDFGHFVPVTQDTFFGQYIRPYTSGVRRGAVMSGEPEHVPSTSGQQAPVAADGGPKGEDKVRNALDMIQIPDNCRSFSGKLSGSREICPQSVHNRPFFFAV